MKSWSVKAAFIILGTGTLVSCAASEQEVNKRQEKTAQLAEFNKILADKTGNTTEQNSGDSTPDSGSDSTQTVELPTNELKMPAIKLAADANLASLKVADLILVNKLSATEFILYGKDGKSWSYKPAAAAADQLKAISPIVVNPTGSTLYSLPDNQFWFVSPDKLGRQKAAATTTTGEEKTVTVEQYSTGTFLGDKAKIKVLYASADELILHLDSYIVILTIKPSPAPAEIKQLPIEKLPIDLKGDLMAGRSEAGYWFHSASGLFFLAKTQASADVSPWSKSAFSMEPVDLSSLAFWPNEAQLKYSGESLGLSATGIFSDVVQAATGASLR